MFTQFERPEIRAIRHDLSKVEKSPDISKIFEQCAFEAEPYKFAGKTDRIIDCALEALGLDESFLFEFLEVTLSDRMPGYFRSADLSATEWIAICDALYLNVSSISYGYSRREHRAKIRWAMEERFFHLPKNAAVKKLIREIHAQKRADARFRASHYGFRLRWKARIQDLIMSLRKAVKPNPHRYDPQERARGLAAYRATKQKQLSSETKNNLHPVVCFPSSQTKETYAPG